MATALRSSHVGSSAPDWRLERIFRREIAPHIKALEAERGQGRTRLITTAVGIVCVLMVLIGALWPLDHAWAAVAVVVVLAVGVNVLGSQQRRFRHRVRDLVMPAICETVGDLQHSTGDAAAIPFQELERVGLLPNHDRRIIDDVFEGRHRDTAFVMADARLRYRSHGRRRHTRTVFQGLIFAIEAPGEIPAPILIARDAGALGNHLTGWIKGFSGLKRVVLPHAAFEAQFAVYSDRPEIARDTVGPGMCDALVALAEGHQGRPMQAAFRGRWFYLTMPGRKDQFRLGSLFRSLDGLGAEAQRVLEDVRIVHRVIDTLHGAHG
jgi:Protein of unknown function (DUF3137)